MGWRGSGEQVARKGSDKIHIGTSPSFDRLQTKCGVVMAVDWRSLRDDWRLRRFLPGQRRMRAIRHQASAFRRMPGWHAPR